MNSIRCTLIGWIISQLFTCLSESLAEVPQLYGTRHSEVSSGELSLIKVLNFRHGIAIQGWLFTLAFLSYFLMTRPWVANGCSDSSPCCTASVPHMAGTETDTHFKYISSTWKPQTSSLHTASLISLLNTLHTLSYSMPVGINCNTT